jgi:hypothetical protein
MRQLETNPDIDIKISLAKAGHSAHWNFDKGRHGITLNIPLNWQEGIAPVEEHYRNHPEMDLDEDRILGFLDEMDASFMAELICIERRRQGLRMKHDRCEPCCLSRIVFFIMNHCHHRLIYPLPDKWEAAKA